MKLIALIAAYAFLGATARADVDISREEAGTIKTYDIPELEAKSPSLENQIVRIKYNYRAVAVVDQKDGFYYGRLGIWRTDSRAGRAGYQSGYLKVRVPALAIAWFRKISTNEETHQTFTVLARVDKTEGESASVQLLGREIKTDTKGSHIVW